MKKYVKTFENFINQNTNPEDLEIFILGEDIPTCPHCGTRTDFDQLVSGAIHTCLDPKCGFQFIGEFDDEFDTEDDELSENKSNKLNEDRYVDLSESEKEFKAEFKKLFNKFKSRDFDKEYCLKVVKQILEK